MLGGGQDRAPRMLVVRKPASKGVRECHPQIATTLHMSLCLYECPLCVCCLCVCCLCMLSVCVPSSLYVLSVCVVCVYVSVCVVCVCCLCVLWPASERRECGNVNKGSFPVRD